MISTGRRSLVAAVLCIAACFSTSSAFAAPVEDLNFGQWSLISIPADPGATGTVEALFGDDLPAAEYGSNWLIYAFDSAANAYRLLALDEPLEANKGYWIFQRVADPAEVDVPESLSALTGSDQVGCVDGQLCVAVPLTSNTSFPVWNAVGYSSENQALFGDTRFVTASGACADGCTPAEALTANVAQSVMFTLNSAGTAYEVIDEGTAMQPWDGYWLLVLADADQLRWVVPIGDAAPTPPTPPIENPSPVMPELTAPLPGSQLPGSDVTFMWEDNGFVVNQWFLRVGLSEGTGEFAEVRLTDPSAMELSVSGLPTDGVPVFVELSYRKDGVWTNLNFEYTAFDDNAVNPDDFVLVDDNITSFLGGQPFSGNVATNDTIPADAEQQGLLYTVARQPDNGSVSLDAVAGAFTFRPDAGFVGDDFFVYSIVQFDENGNPVDIVASARVNVTIESVVVVDDSLIALSGVEIGDNVLSNDSLPDNAIERGLQLRIIEEPASGIATLDPLDGSYSYVSERGFSGLDTFVYGVVLVDENQQIVAVAAEGTVSVDVEPIVVEDDQFSGVSGQAVFGVAGDNDTLPEAAAVRGFLLRITTPPQNGTVELNPVTGAFTYVSAESFFGTDSFTYALVQIDQQGSEVGVITDDAQVQIDVSAPVTFYRDPNYGGGTWSTTVGTFPNLADTPIPNNSISSIRVAPGFSIFACVFSEFGGRCTNYQRDSRQLRRFNDQIVSVMVTQLEPDISFTPNGLLSDYTVSGLSGVGTGDAVMSGEVILSERTRCASEGETCTLPEDGEYTVFYGVEERFARIDNVTGSIACNNETFGNPRPGVRKFCEYVSEIRTPELTLEIDQGYVVTEQPAKGEVLMSPTGRYLYTPTSKFAGTDSFQYALVRFNQIGGVAERLAEATVTLDYIGFLSFEGDAGSFDNAIGTYELDANGNPTNLQGVLIRTNRADFGKVVGSFKELPRLFLIGDAGDRASETARLEWDGGNGIRSNGSRVPLDIIWADARFNATGRNLIRYRPTDDGELIISFEDNLNGGDGDFDDTSMRLSFDPTADE